MRGRLTLLFSTVLLVMSCASSTPPKEDNPYLGTPQEDQRPMQVAYLGGNGSSCDTAIVIKGAANTFQGIAAENRWLKEHYPDAEKVSTKTGDCPDRITDVVGLRMPDGTLKLVIFDISEFYGRY